MIIFKGPYPSIFDFSPLAEIAPIFYSCCLNWTVYTLVDLRLHFKLYSLPFMLKQGIETL